ncbi:MAG: hypothetical protein J5I98_29935 [Phaeodactylibacter sp.]|nr:hypothetical protein [Lewinellaceae bacterium]MCO6492676.1 hypothetical protein [Phaeodactylibacter sp.]
MLEFLTRENISLLAASLSIVGFFLTERKHKILLLFAAIAIVVAVLGNEKKGLKKSELLCEHPADYRFGRIIKIGDLHSNGVYGETYNENRSVNIGEMIIDEGFRAGYDIYGQLRDDFDWESLDGIVSIRQYDKYLPTIEDFKSSMYPTVYIGTMPRDETFLNRKYHGDFNGDGDVECVYIYKVRTSNEYSFGRWGSAAYIVAFSDPTIPLIVFECPLDAGTAYFQARFKVENDSNFGGNELTVKCYDQFAGELRWFATYMMTFNEGNWSVFSRKIK